jgi:hypothetical protein
MKCSISFAVIVFALLVASATECKAQSGTIAVTYSSCPSNSSYLGYATIQWSTSGPVVDDVMVTVARFNTNSLEAITVFASGHSGSSSASWIQYQHSYAFNLVHNATTSNVNTGYSLASTVVGCGGALG